WRGWQGKMRLQAISLRGRRMLAGFLVLLLGMGIFFCVRRAVVAVNVNPTAPWTPMLVIDAGHGGFDGGAVGVGDILEKDINLAIARRLQQLAELVGFDVIMTREEDISVDDEGTTGARNRKISDIHNRLALAQKNPQAIFLSIHQNKFPQSQSWGAQIFYGPKNPRSRALAQCLQDHLRTQLQPENKRAIKPAEKNLYILSRAENPAVLIECGFLSNPEECAQLCTPSYQQELAMVILISVMEHLQLEASQQAGDPENLPFPDQKETNVCF
ncbi:MAG: N-acetylmuramoyl-L-alanine amidase, partial [Oscillospiraceae bacterium]